MFPIYDSNKDVDNILDKLEISHRLTTIKEVRDIQEKWFSNICSQMGLEPIIFSK